MALTAQHQEHLTFDHYHIWHPYTSLPAQYDHYLVERAQGVHLHLADGRTLIDGMASWWSAIHGYNNPKLNQALVNQAKNMSHVMFGGLTHSPAIELAKRLVDITPHGLEYVFFSDSGSVAVEVAMKMALQYWQQDKYRLNETKRHRFLTVKQGYHGDTFAAMSVCDPVTGMHHLFAESLQQQVFAPAPEPAFNAEFSEQTHGAALRELCEKHHRELAAIILEPIVQGAGGMRFYSPAYLKFVRDLCDEFGLLLIADEIATGFGRTGKLFACEHAGISPDILCIGKAMTGGYMSLAATLCNQKVQHQINMNEANTLMHGPTYMANPLACALANASIDLLLSSPWQAKVQQMESILQQGLQPASSLKQVADVRVLGAIGVVELKEPVDMREIQQQFVDAGVWIRPFGKLVYIMPPYVINKEQLEQLCAVICQVVADQ